MPVKKFKVNKLVRDKTHDRLIQQGVKPYERILSEEEYKRCLSDKLNEEVLEVIEEMGHSQELISEIADVLEVLRALAALHAIAWQDVESVRVAKRAERGGFERRLYSESVEMDESNPKMAYFAQQPEKYPEI